MLVPLLLVPDISMIGYLGGPRLGAVTYNLAHNLVTALVALGAGWVVAIDPLAMAGAVLLAHVGMDRTLGYGLKLPTDFKDTHLGRIGPSADPAAPRTPDDVERAHEEDVDLRRG